MMSYDFTKPEHRYMLGRRICMLPLLAQIAILPGLVTTKVIYTPWHFRIQLWIAAKFAGMSPTQILHEEHEMLIEEYGIEKLDIRAQLARHIQDGKVSRRHMEITLDLVRWAEAEYYGREEE